MAVVADRQLEAGTTAPEADADVLSVGVAHDVRERLLRDAVGDELGLGLDVGEVALGLEDRLDAGLALDLVHVPGKRRLEPEIVECGGPQVPGEREQLGHRLVGHQLRLGQLAVKLGRRLLTRGLEMQQHPVSDWLTSSWRSRATRARSSSIACSAALDVRRRRRRAVRACA